MKQMSSQNLVYIARAAMAVVLIVVAGGIFMLLARSRPVVPSTDPNQQHNRVNVFTARAIDVHRHWTGYGTAEAVESANVPARVTATVDQIPPQILEGAVVSKGQLLAELDNSDFVNQLRVTEQNMAAVDAMIEELDRQEKSLNERVAVESDDLELARQELARVKNMFENNAANQKDLDASERTVLSVQRSKLQIEQTLSGIQPRRDQLLAQKAELLATADTARLNVERCSVQSPIDGVLQFVDIEVGESVAPGQRIARVVNTDRIQTPISLPANARSHIRVGDKTYLTSTADPDQSWEAEVTRITPEDDPQTRTFAAYVEVDQKQQSESGNLQMRLSPGVFVRGSVVASESENRVVVPRRSVRIERAMVVLDDILESRMVTEAYAIDGPLPETGLRDQEWAVLTDGIEPGDIVVLTPTRSLSDGQQIEPVMVGNELLTDTTRGQDESTLATTQQGEAR